MSKSQTRRSISTSNQAYEGLVAWCEKNGKSMSGVVEDLIRAHVGMAPRSPSLRVDRPRRVMMTVRPEVEEPKPVPTPLMPAARPVEAPKPKVLADLDAASKIFTF